MGEFVGVICDGNRRDELTTLSASGENISKDQLSDEQLFACYKRGAERVQEIIEQARHESIDTIAFWGLSDKNVDERPRRELGVLGEVFEEYLKDVRDRWMDEPENRDIRMVHMGRQDRLQTFAPRVIEYLHDINEHTKRRIGMVVALCLDYGGTTELRKAQQLWAKDNNKGHVTDHLDLPRQGVAYRELDLLIRTGEDDIVVHDNAFLLPYQGGETRKIFRQEYLPQYTSGLFAEDMAKFRRSAKREGK